MPSVYKPLITADCIIDICDKSYCDTNYQPLFMLLLIITIMLLLLFITLFSVQARLISYYRIDKNNAMLQSIKINFQITGLYSLDEDLTV